MKKIDPKSGKAIGVAMKSPEDGVPVPSARRSSSFTAVVSDLGLGESCARIEDMTHVYTMADDPATLLNEAKEKLRNNVAPSMANAKHLNDHAFSQQVTQFVTPTGRLFIISIVTRTG